MVFGPHRSFPVSEGEVLGGSQNDYLNYRVVDCAGLAVNFDYVFGDQACHVLGEMFQVLSDRYDHLDVNVVHFGKVGILNDQYGLGSLLLPMGALEETEVLRGDLRPVPIHNQLVLNAGLGQFFVDAVGVPHAQGRTVNTVSVLKQTRSGLEKCLVAGGDFLDMEWSVMDGLGRGYQVNYPNLGRLSYFFAGIGSDKPLQQQTLADTLYPLDVERKVGIALKDLLVKL